jgi:aryl-alcohol dehydrogenase-like predicted oxidoreductase
MARELGVAMVAWAPLGGGFLSGKYSRIEGGSTAPLDESLRMASSKNRVNDRNLAILGVVNSVAKETGHSAAQVAIRWAVQKADVASVVIGARTLPQLEDNLAAAGFHLNDAQVARLDEASKPDLGYPHSYLRSAGIQKFLYGGANIEY